MSEPAWPADVPRFFETDDRREVAACLPQEAADDLEMACVARFLYPEQSPEPARSLPAFLKVAKAARDLEDALLDLHPHDESRLLGELEESRIGRLVLRRRLSYLSKMRRIVSRSIRGGRLVRLVLRGIETAAERLAGYAEERLALDDESGPKIGRPISTDWLAMTDVAAVCAANGINPSEASSQFMRVAAAVWHSAGRDTQPTHAIRVMRSRLRSDPKPWPYCLDIPARQCLYIMLIDSGGRFTSQRVGRADYIDSRVEKLRGWCKKSTAYP